MYVDANGWPVRKIPVRVIDGEPMAPAVAAQSSEPKEKARDVPLFDDGKVAVETTDEPDWQKLALRSQADMDNFRKRQIRRADDSIAAERQRLLRLFLSVADNLERALGQDGQDVETLRQGVELTYRELMRTLEAEGVTRIETVGRPFDPELHDAVAAIPSETEEAGVIVQEMEAGYKLGASMLRPARVVVAA
jgi:molecular chaperone GrpE